MALKHVSNRRDGKRRVINSMINILCGEFLELYKCYIKDDHASLKNISDSRYYITNFFVNTIMLLKFLGYSLGESKNRLPGPPPRPPRAAQLAFLSIRNG